MPTVEDLDRLKKAMATLAGLEAARGELIRAEDWNPAGRHRRRFRPGAAGARGCRRGGAAARASRDRVTAEWLAPALRAQIERGSLADPAQSLRLSAAELRLTRLSRAARHPAIGRDRSAGSLRHHHDARHRAPWPPSGPSHPQRRGGQRSWPAARWRCAIPQERAGQYRQGDRCIGAPQRCRRPADRSVARTRRAPSAISTSSRSACAAPVGEFLDFASLENKLADISAKSVAQDQLTEAIRNAANTRPPNLDQLEASTSSGPADSLRRQPATI